MSVKSWFAEFEKNQRFATLSALMLVWVMMICILQIFVAIGEQVYPGWSGTYIIWFGAIVAIEAIITNYLVIERAEKIGLIYRASEILIILMSLKLVQLIQTSGKMLIQGFFDWDSFIDSFFSGGFLFIFFFMIIIWGLCNAYARDIYALQSYLTDLELGGFIQLRSERINARNQIANLYLAGGVVLILLVSLARLDLRMYDNMVGDSLSLPLGINIIPLMIYFLSGLVLLSLSQFAILRGAWLMGNVPIAPKIAANWLRYSIIIFGAAGLLIVFLPTDYSINIMESGLIIINYLFEAIFFLIGLVIFPFIYIYSLILSLLGNSSPPTSQQLVPEFDLTPDRTPPGVLPPWFEMVKNILFWSILSAGMVFFVWHYIRLNKTWLEGLQWRGFSHWMAPLRKWFNLLFPKIRKQIDKIIAFGKKEKSNSETNAIRNWRNRSINLKNLSDRDKVLYYYESFLKEAEGLGIGKKPSQTPDQYANQLHATYPQQGDELDALTRGFIEARYCGKQEMEKEANQIKKVWKNLIKQLKLTISG